MPLSVSWRTVSPSNTASNITLQPVKGQAWEGSGRPLPPSSVGQAVLVVRAADVEEDVRRDLAVLVGEHAHHALLHGVGRRVERVGADRALVAAVHADDREVLLQRGVQLLAVVDVAALGEHAPDDLPHHQRVLVEVRGVEVRQLAVLRLERRHEVLGERTDRVLRVEVVVRERASPRCRTCPSMRSRRPA